MPTRLILHHHGSLVVHLACTLGWTLKVVSLLVRISLAVVSVHPFLRTELRVCIAGAFESNFASLDGDDSVNNVLKRAFVIFAIIVTHLVCDSITFLQSNADATLLALLHLTLATYVLLGLVCCSSLSHLNSPYSTAVDSGIVSSLRSDSLL